MGQNQTKNRTEKIRRISWIFLWIMVVLGLLLLLEYRFHFLKNMRKEKDDIIGPCGSRFSLVKQETLLVSGELLYYSDLKQEESLCSYNLKTKEIQLLEQTKGVLKRTGTGIYYITEFIVYRIEDGMLFEVCPVPESRMRFVDFYENRSYWLATEEEEDAEWRRRKIYIQEPVSQDAWRLLYQTEDATVTIRDAVMAHQKLYVMADDGIYAVETISGKAEKLSDLYSIRCISDGIHVVFEGFEREKKNLYYEILPDGQIIKRTNGAGVAAIYQEKLYYKSEGLKVCDLTAMERESELPFETPSMYSMEVCGQGIFSRDYPYNNIWFCDLKDGRKACIIPQKQMEDMK